MNQTGLFRNSSRTSFLWQCSCTDVPRSDEDGRSTRLSNVGHSQPLLESSYNLIFMSRRTHIGIKTYPVKGILGHPTKCAIRSTLFTLRSAHLIQLPQLHGLSPDNGRMTVNDELVRMWNEITVAYDALGDCLESLNSHPNFFQSGQQTFGPKQNCDFIYTKQKCQPLYGVLQNGATHSCRSTNSRC